MKYDLKDLEKATNDLCKFCLLLSKTNKNKPWSLNDLEVALKQLKNDKSIDALGHANEIFTLSVAGTDLLEAVLKLMKKRIL